MKVTPKILRDEGVIEIGCAPGTSVLFVLTRRKLHLIHPNMMEDRAFDDYALKLAVRWILEDGMGNCHVADLLGVCEKTVATELGRAGYVRLQQKRPNGNRRGKLVRRDAVRAEAKPRARGKPFGVYGAYRGARTG